MTEECIFKMDTFRKEMKRLGIALIWVAPAFSQNWDPQTGCQTIFEDMMKNIGYQSGHKEIGSVPVAVQPFTINIPSHLISKIK